MVVFQHLCLFVSNQNLSYSITSNQREQPTTPDLVLVQDSMWVIWLNSWQVCGYWWGGPSAWVVFHIPYRKVVFRFSDWNVVFHICLWKVVFHASSIKGWFATHTLFTWLSKSFLFTSILQSSLVQIKTFSWQSLFKCDLVCFLNIFIP